ncbi:unnamed protein product [Protopolystoma xenopodis]|uniref:Uncharacterized protein n=1 Tax=Protopolystoma xenopodis TaxID=117903 RepID=A0A3S5CUY5_9PLAT|nr:unnamed protein product [Protopolystoma xenopodis]
MLSGVLRRHLFSSCLAQGLCPIRVDPDIPGAGWPASALASGRLPPIVMQIGQQDCLTEATAAACLDAMRSLAEGFVSLSFGTISGVGMCTLISYSWMLVYTHLLP